MKIAKYPISGTNHLCINAVHNPAMAKAGAITPYILPPMLLPYSFAQMAGHKEK